MKYIKNYWDCILLATAVCIIIIQPIVSSICALYLAMEENWFTSIQDYLANLKPLFNYCPPNYLPCEAIAFTLLCIPFICKRFIYRKYCLVAIFIAVFLYTNSSWYKIETLVRRYEVSHHWWMQPIGEEIELLTVNELPYLFKYLYIDKKFSFASGYYNRRFWASCFLGRIIEDLSQIGVKELPKDIFSKKNTLLLINSNDQCLSYLGSKIALKYYPELIEPFIQTIAYLRGSPSHLQGTYRSLAHRLASAYKKHPLIIKPLILKYLGSKNKNIHQTMAIAFGLIAIPNHKEIDKYLLKSNIAGIARGLIRQKNPLALTKGFSLLRDYLKTKNIDENTIVAVLKDLSYQKIKNDDYLSFLVECLFCDSYKIQQEVIEQLDQIEEVRVLLAVAIKLDNIYNTKPWNYNYGNGIGKELRCIISSTIYKIDKSSVYWKKRKRKRKRKRRKYLFVQKIGKEFNKKFVIKWLLKNNYKIEEQVLPDSYKK